jgi:phospholipase D1/2
MLDQDFSIERPKRAYRTGFHLLTGKSLKRKEGDPTKAIQPEHEGEVDTENPFTQEMMIQNGEGKGNAADQMQDEEEVRASQHTFFISNSQRKLKLVTKNAVSPVLYLSRSALSASFFPDSVPVSTSSVSSSNPFFRRGPLFVFSLRNTRPQETADSQRQMHQFIVSMERIAAQSAWTGMNRFDSFAPLRVNVAAQWLVDGVSD